MNQYNRQEIKKYDEEKERLCVSSVPESKNKWLYLIGDGSTHVRLKYFIIMINNSLYSYKDGYEMRSVLSYDLSQVILGIGVLYGGGFSILNSIYTVLYGGYLQKF